MKTEFTSQSAVDDAIWYVDFAKRRLATVRKNSKLLRDTIDLLNRRCALVDSEAATMYVWTDVNPMTTGPYGNPGSVTVCMNINAHTDSMIEGVVPQILKAMLDIECDPETTTDLADATKAQRIYQFKRPASDHFLAVQIKVEVNIRETDTGTCRKVQTGTKIVEVAEYALECTGAQS